MAVTSRAADLFLEQPTVEQRKFLRLLVGEASWKAGELRMSLNEPFEQLRLSNSVNNGNHKELDAETPNFDIRRATVDAFRTFLADVESDARVSNLTKRSFLQQLGRESKIPDSHCMGGRDTSRTASGDRLQEQEPRPFNGQKSLPTKFKRPKAPEHQKEPIRFLTRAAGFFGENQCHPIRSMKPLTNGSRAPADFSTRIAAIRLGAPAAAGISRSRGINASRPLAQP